MGSGQHDFRGVPRGRLVSIPRWVGEGEEIACVCCVCGWGFRTGTEDRDLAYRMLMAVGWGWLLGKMHEGAVCGQHRGGAA